MKRRIRYRSMITPVGDSGNNELLGERVQGQKRAIGNPHLTCTWTYPAGYDHE